MSEYQIPDDMDTLLEWVRTKEEEQAEAVQVIPKIAAQIQEDLSEENKLKAQMMEIVRRRRARENIRDAAKKAIKDNEAVVIAAKRKLETFQSEKAIQARIENEAAEFDRITQHYQWREFAFDHQISGARRLASARRGILGDKRGLGKSLTSLVYADMLGAKRVLVFAPKDVLQNFEREIKHWTPHRHVAVLGGMPKIQRDMFLGLLAQQEQYLILCNYEAWRRDPELLDNIKNLRADTVIIDEAHNIKEKRTSAYQGIRGIVYADNKCNICGGTPEKVRNSLTGTYDMRCSTCLHEPEEIGDFCSVKNVLPMTGTAILNKPQDLWTLLNLVDRRLFPSEKAFLEDYCTLDYDTGRWKFRTGGEEALIAKLGPRFVKRDKKSAGIEGMPQLVIPHTIQFDKNLYPDQWAVMKQIADFGAIKMAEDIKLDVIGILPELMRRRQAITWPQGIKIWEQVKDEFTGMWRKTGKVLYEAPATESIKMDKAMEIATEIINEEEDRLVIFSQFKEALKEFDRRFKRLGISVVRYDGDTSDYTANQAQLDFDGKTAANHPKHTSCREDCVNWLKDKPITLQTCKGYQWQVILCHYKKGGVGLNLNAARQMIILDREWNPGKEDQAFGRIDRMDNKQDSIVHTIHVEGTIDAFMDSLIDEKSKIIDGFDTEQNIQEQMIAALRNGELL